MTVPATLVSTLFRGVFSQAPVNIPAFAGTVVSKTFSPSGNYYYSAFGDNRFVIQQWQSASNTVLETSDVATTWTQSAAPASGIWAGMSYGAGKFVAVMDNSTTAMYSSDGINWSASSLPNTNTRWLGTAYVNNKFIAFGVGTNAASSTDGVNWSPYSLSAAGAAWLRLAYGNGAYVMIGASGWRAYSTTGASGSWTQSFLSPGFINVVYGNGKFVATSADVSGTSRYTYTSTDGINWTTHANALVASAVHSGLAYGNGVFISTFESGGSAGGVEYSTDGITWTSIPAATVNSGGGWRAATYGNGVFLITGTGGKALIIS